MIFKLQRILFGLCAVVVVADLAWAAIGHFQIDIAAYAQLAAISLALLGGGIFYQIKRAEPGLAAMLMGASFLCLFSAAASVLNYFFLTLHGPRIDHILMAADRALGFDWYATMLFMARHPLLNEVFFRVYNMVLPEIALVMVALAWTGRVEKMYRYCLALGFGALIAIAIWALAPSFGAISLSALPPEVAKLPLSLDGDYGKALVALLQNGSGYITPRELRGLIAFPSYHGVLALLMAWYGWHLRRLRWPLVLLNAAIIVSSPVQGGHHMVDMLASFPVAALSIFLAARCAGPVPKRVRRVASFEIRPHPAWSAYGFRTENQVMFFKLQRILFGLSAVVVAADLLWAAIGHFQIDIIAYARLGLMSLALAGGGIFYQIRRTEPELAAMLMGASFLCLFSAAASMLNYFFLTLHGPRIDNILVAADRALGFDWYGTMLFMARHPLLNEAFFHVYNMVLPEIALVMVALAWTGQVEKVYRYCLALAAGALIAIALWALAPSLGAKSLYLLPPEVASKLTLSVTGDYGKALVALLRDGPGYITPSDLRGLIAFPSYHGVLALIVAWYGWHLRPLRWPLLLLNAAVIISSPIQGGHHMVDLLGSFPVAALSIFLAALCARKPALMVNNSSTEAVSPVPARA